MTQKENLLVLYYGICNELADLKHEDKKFDIESLIDKGVVKWHARKFSVADLNDMIQMAKNSIVRYKKAAARNAFLLTEEGKKALLNIKNRRVRIHNLLDEIEKNAAEKLNKILAEHVSSELKVRRISRTHVEIGIDKAEQFSSFEIFFEARRFGSGEPRFEVSVGSTGCFELGSERAKLYVLLGKFLSTVAQNKAMNLLLGFNEQYEEQGKKLYEIDKEEKELGTVNE